MYILLYFTETILENILFNSTSIADLFLVFFPRRNQIFFKSSIITLRLSFPRLPMILLQMKLLCPFNLSRSNIERRIGDQIINGHAVTAVYEVRGVISSILVGHASKSRPWRRPEACMHVIIYGLPITERNKALASPFFLVESRCPEISSLSDFCSVKSGFSPTRPPQTCNCVRVLRTLI